MCVCFSLSSTLMCLSLHPCCFWNRMQLLWYSLSSWISASFFSIYLTLLCDAIKVCRLGKTSAHLWLCPASLLRYDNLLRASTSLNLLMHEWKPLQWPRLLCQLRANVTAFFGALCLFPSPLKNRARVHMRLWHDHSFLPFRLQMVWHVSACMCLRWITSTEDGLDFPMEHFMN